MKINFKGRLAEEPMIRAGFIGCGSHSFRNIYPTFQHAPVDLVATCDLDHDRAAAFAHKFGAQNAYTDYHEMLQKEKLDAVFIVTGYDKAAHPLYPTMAKDCMEAGCHVWIEKPPAATSGEIEMLQQVSAATKKTAMVGLKKMFFPANVKAKELMSLPDFGQPTVALFQYPQSIPTQAQFDIYVKQNQPEWKVVSFLDHLCHPASLMLYLLGMPDTLFFQRSNLGAGIATFTFSNGLVATLALTHGAPRNGGMERTTIIGSAGRTILVDNNLHVSYHRDPPDLGYGTSPSFYTGTPEQTTAVWEPEFSLGQLYNKGLFLLGYYGEVNEFALSILENRPPGRGTLEHAWQVTHLFEAFAEGAGKVIQLKNKGAK